MSYNYQRKSFTPYYNRFYKNPAQTANTPWRTQDSKEKGEATEGDILAEVREIRELQELILERLEDLMEGRDLTEGSGEPSDDGEEVDLDLTLDEEDQEEQKSFHLSTKKLRSGNTSKESTKEQSKH